MRNQFEHLSFDEMYSLAPSIFAETPHESRSDRYAYIPTIQIVEGMMKEGFLPFSVMQARSRSESRREYTKHLTKSGAFIPNSNIYYSSAFVFSTCFLVLLLPEIIL